MNDNRFDFENQENRPEDFQPEASITPEAQPETMQTAAEPAAQQPSQPAEAAPSMQAEQTTAGVPVYPEAAAPAEQPVSQPSEPVGQPEQSAVSEEAQPIASSPSYEAVPHTETAAGMDYSASAPHKDIRSGEYRVPHPIQTPIYSEGASSMHQQRPPYASQNTPPYGASQTPYQQSPFAGQQPQAYGQPTPPKKKKEKKNRKFGLGAMIGVACASALLCSVISSSVVGAVMLNTQGAQASQTGQNGSNKTVYVDSKTETSVASIAEKVSPSVVGIRVTSSSNNFNPFSGSGSSVGEGSGVIYTQDGYIITNYHVISTAVEGSSNSNSMNPYGIFGNNGNSQQSTASSTIEVFLPSDAENGIEATVVGYDVSADLAVLKIDKTGLPAIEIGDSDAISVGDTAIAIGNPGGLQFMGSVSTGIISGLNRTIQTESGTEMNLIQTDAAINPGNSGGALVNIGGQLIGINNSKMSGEDFEGMGFSIPVNEVVSICDRIINNQSEPQPYLGVTINQNLTSDWLQQMGYPAGVVVYSVADNSPASDAGIQAGDIITAINGTEVTSYTQLTSEKNKYVAGDTITVTVFRNGQSVDLSLVLAASN